MSQLDSISYRDLISESKHYGEVKKITTSYFGLFNSLQSRVLVLKGNYLFRYAMNNNNNDSAADGSLIGSPLLLSETSFNKHPSNQKAFEVHCEAIDKDSLSVSKYIVYECPSTESCELWLTQLRSSKDACIKESLGHLNISESDKFSNDQAQKVINKMSKEKDSIDNLVRDISIVGPIAYNGGVPPSCSIVFHNQLGMSGRKSGSE